MDVSAVMTEWPITVEPEMSLERAMVLMDDHHIRHLPVLDDGRLVGLFSDRELLSATGWSPGRWSAGATVADIMHRDVHTVTREDTVVTAIVEMVLGGVGSLAVVDDEGALLGLITETDMLLSLWNALGESEEQETRVGTLMAQRPKNVSPDDTIGDVELICRSIHARHVPVLEQGRLIGIVSDRDLRQARGHDLPGDTPCNRIMTTDVITISPNDGVGRAADLMLHGMIGSLPVVEDDALVGILTLTDLVDHALDTLREPDKA